MIRIDPASAARTSALMWALAACGGDEASPGPQPNTMSPGAAGTSTAPPAGNGGVGAAPAGTGAGAGAGGPAVAGRVSTAPSAGSDGRPSAGASGMVAQAGASGMTGASGATGAGGLQPSAAGQSGAQAGAGMSGGGGGNAPMAGANCLQGSGDYVDDGPYKVKSKSVSIGDKGMFTIYYPDPLETSCPHPFVAWGNGTTITGGTAYDHFLKHGASWGIVQIASHNSNVGDGSFHKAAIDYLIAQNKESGSEFFGKLSDRAGVSGHSQGGAGADRAANHPNVKADVNVQGSFGTPPMSQAALLCLTGTEDINPSGCPMAVNAATVPAVCASWDGADHVSTTLGEGEGIEQYKRLYSAWFRCFLADDQNACALFKGGADCPVCKEDGWEEIFAKNY